MERVQLGTTEDTISRMACDVCWKSRQCVAVIGVEEALLTLSARVKGMENVKLSREEHAERFRACIALKISPVNALEYELEKLCAKKEA